MSQKEIIHLSFGSFANHVSTHFWNQQQQYFDYSVNNDTVAGFGADRDRDRDRDQHQHQQPPPPLVDHDVSFKAGIGTNGVETYTPRTLIFDTSDEMGGLKRINQLYDDLDDHQDTHQGQDSLQSRLADGLNTWSQPASLQRIAKPIPKSNYQKRLEKEDLGLDVDSGEELSSEDEAEEEEEESNFDHQESSVDPAAQSTRRTTPSNSTDHNDISSKSKRRREKEREKESDFQYWSNYNRSFFHPNSILPIGGQLLAPMTGSNSKTSYNNSQGMNRDLQRQEDGRNRFESWEFGVRTFDETEKESQLLDNSLRFQSEDCDSLQSFQLFSTINDGFSGFSFRMLEEISDEYSKTEKIVWGLGWGEEDWRDEFGGGSEGRRLANFRRMNSVLSLSNFSDLSSLYVPLRTPNLNIRSLSRDSRPNWSKHLGRLNLSSMWQSSALVADAIESLTLGMRLREKPFTTSHLVSTLNWRRDTPLASLGICLPTPSMNPSSSTSQSPMDPIEALLASRGYGPKLPRGERGRIESSLEKAKKMAKEIKENWLDLSNPTSSSLLPSSRKGPGKFQIDGKERHLHPQASASASVSGKEAQDLEEYQKFKDEAMKPFSQVAMVRGTSGENQESKNQIMDSVKQWNHCDAPVGGSYHTTLPLSIPTSHPQFFSNLSSNGVPLSLSDASTKPKTRSVGLISSLNISSTLHPMLLCSKRFLTDLIDGHAPLYAYGIGVRGAVGVASSDENDGNVGGRDGLKEIREKLEDLSSCYENEMDHLGNRQDEDEEEGKDQDEEWQQNDNDNDDDWDL